MNRTIVIGAAALAALASGCEPSGDRRVAALDAAAWRESVWISVPEAKTLPDDWWQKNIQRAADGTSWFVGRLENAAKVKKATWMTAGLGVYEVYVNGVRVGSDFLKPGFTHNEKTKYSFTYDVTDLVKAGAGDENFFAAEVSAGWWRDKIVNFNGRKSAFRSVVELEFANGEKQLFGTNLKDWKCGVAGAVKHAAIFDGEEYDARVAQPYFGADDFVAPEENKEFKGEIFPTAGAEVVLRGDLALKPVEAYCWKGVEGEDKAKNVFGKVVKTRVFDPAAALAVEPGETLVVDFGQNCAAVPAFVMKSEPGATLTCLPGEMLNDMNGERSRGNDGPGGSVYRENLRVPTQGMRAVYTFATAKDELYVPRFTFFGYRYVSITADKPVTIKCLRSVPVTSITKEMEAGSLVTGDESLNRFIANVYWGQLSNYLSVPTDCPQRNERLGWTADTQVFTETGAFNADTSSFFRTWMRDMRDTQDGRGGYPGVAPLAQYGSADTMRMCWSDAGIVVPFEMFKQFGDTEIVKENWASMEKYMKRLDETRCEHSKLIGENRNYQWADWLSFEDLESCSGRIRSPDGSIKPAAVLYWNFLYSCYWALDSDMMAAMARGVGDESGVKKYVAMGEKARAQIREKFFDKATGRLVKEIDGLQTANVMALATGVVEGEQRAAVAAHLRELIEGESEIDEAGYRKRVKGVLKTGFLGSHFVMDVLADNGMADLAYTLLLSHKFPSWLYSVDQGATTIWERWNGYVKERGFGPVGMNSFNHYAYGQVVAWIYRRAAGIAADPASPGFRTIVMKPIPDRRLGSVKASYRSAAGLVTSAWRYEGETWIWEFTVPEGAVARVTLPGETESKDYPAGSYVIRR